MKSTRPTSNRKVTNDDKPYISAKARQRPVRIIPADDDAEMLAGHLIPAPDAFAGDGFRGGDDKEGFGTEAADGLDGRGPDEADALEQPVGYQPARGFDEN